MTEKQFKEVIEKAVELQGKRVSERTVNGAKTRLIDFEKKKRKATKLHAACILNDIALEMDGSYNPAAFSEVQKMYLKNVQLVKNYN